ncbi:hypothetical protein [Nostoc sp.]|uniref:hypothetical protein n=1 Tax=Nostoc sp. TaxID=1180 RepID=UPI002FF99F9E
MIKSQKQGNIHPFRLNGVRHVGILRSLAGANPDDETIVALDSITIIDANKEKSILQIEREPVLTTGRFYCQTFVFRAIPATITGNNGTLSGW